jgi:hypothetical protein
MAPSRWGRILLVAKLVLLSLILSALVPPALGAPSITTSSPASGAFSCLAGGQGSSVPSSTMVAVVKPIFTSTPYSQYATSSFYGFYKKYSTTTGNITTDLDWLNTSIESGMSYNSGWGHSLSIYSFLSSSAARECGLVLGKNLKIIDDINVSKGALFNPNGSRTFDAVVIGHQEYVTQSEFDQFRLFVASGGRLIAMSSNMFYAKVNFNPVALTETFVIGHGYAYNGKTAWHSTFWPFNKSSSGWTGSTYCCFKRFQYSGATLNDTNVIGRTIDQYYGEIAAGSYVSHEENAVSNSTRTSIVATFYNKSRITVASFVHEYGRGAVFCLCIFGEDLIGFDPTVQLFLVASVTASLESPAPSVSTSTSNTNSSTAISSTAISSTAKSLLLPILMGATICAAAVAAVVFLRIRRSSIKHPMTS